MSEATVEVDIIMGMDLVFKNAAEAHEIIDKVTTRWAKVKRILIKEGTAILRSVHAIIGVYRSVVKVMGMTIDPMHEILIAYIATTVSTMIMISTAMASTGIGAAVAVYVLTASLVLSTAATAMALQGMDKARSSLDDATGLLDSLGMLGTTLTWI